MKLDEVIAAIDTLPKSATIFARQIDGKFVPESDTLLVELTDADLQRPVKEVAAEKAPGTEYFLEVSIVWDLLDGWRENHEGETPSLAAALEATIFYAENDAYPDMFFG